MSFFLLWKNISQQPLFIAFGREEVFAVSSCGDCVLTQFVCVCVRPQVWLYLHLQEVQRTLWLQELPWSIPTSPPSWSPPSALTRSPSDPSWCLPGWSSRYLLWLTDIYSDCLSLSGKWFGLHWYQKSKHFLPEQCVFNMQVVKLLHFFTAIISTFNLVNIY